MLVSRPSKLAARNSGHDFNWGNLKKQNSKQTKKTTILPFLLWACYSICRWPKKQFIASYIPIQFPILPYTSKHIGSLHAVWIPIPLHGTIRAHFSLSELSTSPFLFLHGDIVMSSFWHQGEAWLHATLHFPLWPEPRFLFLLHHQEHHRGWKSFFFHPLPSQGHEKVQPFQLNIVGRSMLLEAWPQPATKPNPLKSLCMKLQGKSSTMYYLFPLKVTFLRADIVKWFVSMLLTQLFSVCLAMAHSQFSWMP